MAKGDYVKCSYEGMLDDSPVADLLPDKPMYGKQSNTWEEAGQAKGLGIDAIAQAVIGMKKDDKKDKKKFLVDLVKKNKEKKNGRYRKSVRVDRIGSLNRWVNDG